MPNKSALVFYSALAMAFTVALLTGAHKLAILCAFIAVGIAGYFGED